MSPPTACARTGGVAGVPSARQFITAVAGSEYIAFGDVTCSFSQTVRRLPLSPSCQVSLTPIPLPRIWIVFVWSVAPSERSHVYSTVVGALT